MQRLTHIAKAPHIAVLIMALLAAGCGDNKESAGEPGSFAMTLPSPASSTAPAESSPSSAPSVPPKDQSEAPSASASPGEPLQAAAAPSAADNKKPGQPTAVPETAGGSPSAQPKAPEPAPPAASAPAPEETVSAPAKTSSASGNEIKWSEFFDNELQNEPAEKFWDLNGQTVTIKGYMGEVLSFEKHWFLVIPSPGAECPFDNGDESFWNKIMIAFTDKGEKLRFTSGPLQITGRLDVGIKIDESGYKTMFRLYEAKFDKLKE